MHQTLDLLLSQKLVIKMGLSKKEDKILEVFERLRAAYQLRLHLIEIFPDNPSAYVEASELILNIEEELWLEVEVAGNESI